MTLSLKERGKMGNNVFFIYEIREIKSGDVLYVGVTRMLGRRFNEHVNALTKLKGAGIYDYMHKNELEFYKDVEFVVVDRVFNRDIANKIEARLIKQYADTVQNNIKVDRRVYNYDCVTWVGVKCIEDNICFPNVNKAVKHYGISRYKITKSADENKATEINKTFQYLK